MQEGADKVQEREAAAGAATTGARGIPRANKPKWRGVHQGFGAKRVQASAGLNEREESSRGRCEQRE